MSAALFSGISAEAKGKLRLWKTAAARRVEALDRILRSRETGTLVAEFSLRTSTTGQQRAFKALRRRLGTWPALEFVQVGREPLALWALLRPRGALMAWSDNPSERQDCVVVDCIIAGSGIARPGFDCAMAGGFWSLEVTDHALGRLLQRCPRASLDQVLLEAHHNALRIRTDDVFDGFEDSDRSYLLRAGEGCFIISMIRGKEADTGEVSVGIRCHTWIHGDQLTDRQVLLDTSGSDGHRLQHFMLLPDLMRKRVLREVEKMEEAA